MKESRNSPRRSSGESQDYGALGSSAVKCESEKFLCDLRLSNAANPFLCGYYPSGTYRRMVWSDSGGSRRLALKGLVGKNEPTEALTHYRTIVQRPADWLKNRP